MFDYAALIPFTEFREKLVMEKYDVKVDAEVLDLLDTVSRQKHVCVVFVFIPTLCNLQVQKYFFFAHELDELLIMLIN